MPQLPERAAALRGGGVLVGLGVAFSWPGTARGGEPPGAFVCLSLVISIYLASFIAVPASVYHTYRSYFAYWRFSRRHGVLLDLFYFRLR